MKWVVGHLPPRHTTTPITPIARLALSRRGGIAGLAGVALLALAALYFALTGAAGIVSTNDGSHYALTRALADDGTARIDPYVGYTAIQPRRGTPTPADYRDVSFYDGHFYSDRPPGTAVLAVPFYWAGKVAGALSGRRDVDFPLRYVTMLPPVLGALTALALYALARGLGAGPAAAVATAAAGAVGTLLLKYATLLYSHIAAAACVTAALAGIFASEGGAWDRAGPRRWGLAASGGALGYSGVVEYPNLLLLLPCGAYLLWRARAGGWHRTALLAFAAGWAVPVLLLLGYHWAVFDRPWRTSYTYQYYFDWSRRLETTYVTPPWTGLRWLLLGQGRPAGGAGLLTVTPAFLLALWGLAILAWRGGESRARAALLAGVVLCLLLPTAAHRTYYGGGSRDTRYLLAIVPALYAPLAVWFEAFVQPRRRAVRLGWLLVAAALSGWGLMHSFLSLFAMFGHAAVERPPGGALALLRDCWREPGVVAPGLWLEPYFLVLAIPLTGLVWLGWVRCGLPPRPGR